MADTSAWMKRGAKMADIRRHAATLLYLGGADKVMAALVNEYGVDRPLPSRASIQELIDARKARATRERRDMMGDAL